MSPYGWDLTKARENEARHGVSFDEAATVLDSTLAHWAQDLEHSEQEDRTRVVGWSAQGRLLIVIVSATGRRPRVISARRATKHERHAYIDRRP